MIELETILDEIDKEFKVKLRKNTKTRKREIVLIRSVYYKIARKYTKHSTTSIGKPLKKDHATVLNGLNKYDNLLAVYPEFVNKIKKVDSTIKYICEILTKEYYTIDYYKDKKLLVDQIIQLKEKNALLKSRIKAMCEIPKFDNLNNKQKVIKSINKVHDSNFDTFLDKLDALCELNKHELQRR